MQSCNLIRCDDEAMTDLFQGSRPEVALGLRCGFLGRRERTESAQFRTSAVTMNLNAVVLIRCSTTIFEIPAWHRQPRSVRPFRGHRDRWPAAADSEKARRVRACADRCHERWP